MYLDQEAIDMVSGGFNVFSGTVSSENKIFILSIIYTERMGSFESRKKIFVIDFLYHLQKIKSSMKKILSLIQEIFE